MNVTQHFQARVQQRSISPAMVDLILDLGEPNEKGDRMLLGKKEIDQEIMKLKNEIRLLEKIRARGVACIVHAGGDLITAFHIYKKS
ncbi:hypothetical protein [Pseudomonas sediminis]|uniref:hypothetical protein n=1 Tax=Pseudomonas sediminis TaxID=1691904 RepID=UPI0031CC871C